ncbi:HNH endonuclease [Vibrio sp. B1-2]|uniref:HNH endonuclease n=1 Tax=Vibrio sp. B1-2 TaxID=2591465 RepID=UPI00148314D8|nr:HNH endonuclease [Vibrio sp. B1-2]
MKEINDNELKLLKYLIEICQRGKVIAGDPRTYVSYGEVLEKMGFPNDGRTVGDSLNKHAMGGLAHWLAKEDLPAITGLIIYSLKSTQRPGMPAETYFTFHGREDMDFAWHKQQIQIACDCNWVDELNRRNIDIDNEFSYADEITEPTSVVEGSKKTITVNAYERSTFARNECIRLKGDSCIVCGFNFGKFYGEKAEGFIHVHHLVPLHEINEEYEVDPEKHLVPVCPNCHAMLHRKDAPSIEKLRDEINFQTILNRGK